MVVDRNATIVRSRVGSTIGGRGRIDLSHSSVVVARNSTATYARERTLVIIRLLQRVTSAGSEAGVELTELRRGLGEETLPAASLSVSRDARRTALRLALVDLFAIRARI